jgi:hypothetical protein
MKLKTIKTLGFGLMVAAGLTTAANAQVVYTFDEGGIISGYGTGEPSVTGSVTLSGSLSAGTYDITGYTGGNIGATLSGTSVTVTSISYGETPPGTGLDIYLQTAADNILGAPGSYTPTLTILSDGDLVFNYVTFSGASGVYNLYTGTSSPNEQHVQDNGVLGGDWVPVPEPTTIMSGMLLLLPFGASTLRIVRKNRAA